MPDLGNYLMRAGHRIREPGIFDCCAFPADWAVECGWPDPMEEWRGAYETESEAHDLIDAAGGLGTLFARGMAAAGIQVSDTFAIGDIGLVQLPSFGGISLEAGAIFTGKRWAFAAERGFAAASLDPVAILMTWRVA